MRAGRTCVTWQGPEPKVTLMDPKLVREVLSNKSGHFPRPIPNPAFKLFAAGILAYEGEKWAKHRRIMNVAFHLEKLKVRNQPCTCIHA